ncbi:nucleotidyltransferase family protein [Pararhodobacter aggregans]|uniref:CTP--molybdopterin cytidylyltransferase n=1 Tax=Pararhodobacter aggregans TaxID=404875 RepID=A0A2T7UVH6_9RHOB|nr:nucleotidyltransferase family protein [Pararhodobacter aggregans]PTX03738.1 CTP:molybdopterin cytidylyltransferase MocA [Pararhodobacter aggregans]PVE48773.1 CTP--molybdopterin cytidylyltransferase [Pararhodobacter aggregans]
MSPPRLRLVLLAAGGSTRMRGGDKLLEEVEGLPLIRRQVLAMQAAGLGPVAVTLPPDRPQRVAALEGLDVECLTIGEAAEGMSASLKGAARWAEGSALLLAPADMPELTAEDFRRLAAGYDGARPLRATAEDGTPGHPVIFPPALLPLFAGLGGDDGARSILKAHPPRLIALPGQRAVTDLDTPEDWAAWRGRSGGQPPHPRDI